MTEPRILLEDEWLLAVHKPAGLAVESARITQTDLLSLMRVHLQGAPVYPVHRLDQPVEGIVLIAKTKAAAAALSAQLTDGRMKKLYLAKVEGEIGAEEAELTNWLVTDRKKNRTLALPCKDGEKKPRPDAKRAVLRCRRRAEHLLEVELLTGRHHQIRAQLAYAGTPIAGDVKYGSTQERLPGGAIALCAYKLKFIHPGTKKETTLEVKPAFLL